MNHCVAGLDLSLRSAGIGVIRPDGSSQCWTVEYEIAKKCSERDRMERVLSICNDVMKILNEQQPRYVGIENYGFSGHGLTKLAELTGNVKTQVYLNLKTVPLILGVGSVRKYLLGKDSRDKSDTRNRLLALGYDSPKNLDESDALAIAYVVNDWANRRGMIVDEHKMSVIDSLDFHQSKIKKKAKKCAD